ncbi:hypothetical protein BAUR920_03154 [Brevibacterium aurantiacum]|uniref:Uncharacterized protein n=1 Tax=Brevibacterium aurantiacum TaxID=273384 RepID=A0A2H1KFC4_BREAU|nr:hypothetical protein BAUR920_03154 [Brevibacterium aurantiacum]
MAPAHAIDGPDAHDHATKQLAPELTIDGPQQDGYSRCEAQTLTVAAPAVASDPRPVGIGLSGLFEPEEATDHLGAGNLHWLGTADDLLSCQDDLLLNARLSILCDERLDSIGRVPQFL